MEPYEQHLQSLWHEGGKEQAKAFLRRALSHKISLDELLAALQFDAVAPHLAALTLKDVLPAQSHAMHAAPVAVATLPSASPKPAKAKRRRRTAEELKVIGELVLQMLVTEPGSLNTTQIVASLEAQGHAFDTMRVNGLLRTFESQGDVVDLGGKPKAWRASASLRQSRSS